MPIKTQHDEQPTLNLTPMIDVVFLLIIFFMVASRFSEVERDIDLKLPEVEHGQSLSAAPKQHDLAVYADGRLLLDGELLSLDDLHARLAQETSQNPRLAVVIRGDGDGAYKHVASALAACQEAGVAELSLSVQLAAAPGNRK